MKSEKGFHTTERLISVNDLSLPSTVPLAGDSHDKRFCIRDDDGLPEDIL
jgi:hypothetical protein